MGLCGSLFVVRHSLCQLSPFFNAEFFLFGPCLFERLVTIFSFALSLRKFTSFSMFYDFLNPFLGCFETSSGIVVGVRTGVWVSGCAGVWVCW